MHYVGRNINRKRDMESANFSLVLYLQSFHIEVETIINECGKIWFLFFKGCVENTYLKASETTFFAG